MTLAQGTDLLLLDEPTTYLDLAHAIDVLDLVDDLHESGCTVVMVLHDLNLATRYSDNLVVMRGGAVLAQGHPRDVDHRGAAARGVRAAGQGDRRPGGRPAADRSDRPGPCANRTLARESNRSFIEGP
ncbi:hypothetical protein GA0115253_107574 [Streptomyces sp. Termitarium-T10T-6]|nr:hypothetical protein GA0115253_107574 [Streptomyces sp. Termitarium-T10T-6]